jgi:hypothetical protein
VKKRRVTDDQARLLAIGFMRDIICSELATGPGTSNSSHDMAIAYFMAYLPEKWFDEQTSDQSWDHVWLEMNVQLEAIFDALNGEAMRTAQDNPGFQYWIVKSKAPV